MHIAILIEYFDTTVNSNLVGVDINVKVEERSSMPTLSTQFDSRLQLIKFYPQVRRRWDVIGKVRKHFNYSDRAILFAGNRYVILVVFTNWTRESNGDTSGTYRMGARVI